MKRWMLLGSAIIAFLLVCVLCINDSNEKLNRTNDDLLRTIDDIQEEYKAYAEKTLNDLGKKNEEIVKLQCAANKTKIPTYEYTKSEIELLCKCVQAEAGEKNYESQKMITQVILNRVKNGYFPNNITDVIYQSNNGIPQFSVAYNGMLDNQKVNLETYNLILEILLYGYELPDNVLYFYGENLCEGNWVTSLNTYDIVQGTIFAYK